MSNAIWTEKYRPKDFSEIKGQKEIVKRVKAFVEQQNLPHLLFAGPAGVGKTTLSLIIARKMYGEEWHQNFLELNASDERGIDIIRNKVKDFARTRAIGNAPFKIIYLDECLGYNSKITIRSSDGKVQEVRIGDFIENYSFEDYKVMSVDDNGEENFVKLANVMKIPHKQEEGFYKLKIHNKEIEITGNHLLITPEGWKSVNELKIGDFVLCPLPQKAGNTMAYEEVSYDLAALPREIKKKERYIANSPEKAVIELLACNSRGLSREEITKLSNISSSKLTSILSNSKNEYYIPLLNYNIINKEKNKFNLIEDKNKALNRLYRAKREQNKKNHAYIEQQLKSRELYPINGEKALVAARIMGHLFTDGCLSLKTKQLFFSGMEEDLKEIKKDINKLGFYGLGTIRANKWRNGECWSFGAYKIDLLSLFYSLGAPVGKKTDTYYLLPSWVTQGNKEIKKEFLASFFGAEGSNPKFQERTIKPVVVAQAKRVDLKENLKEFLIQIRRLLLDFGIESNIKISDSVKNIRKDGTKTTEGKIWIKNSRKNIIRFLDRIGYRYCSYKEISAERALQYLKWKESLGKKVYTFKPVPYFEEWLKNLVVGECSYLYVTGKEKITDPEYVYCLGTENQKFVANGVIVHNCDALTREAQQALRRTMENYTQTCRFILSANYSSKIIDPIQSRCAMFRFKPLEKKDIFTIIEKIEKDEKIKIDEKAKEALYGISEGDARKVENILQSSAAISKSITDEIIYSMASVAKPKELNEVLKLALENKFIDARNKLLDIMLNYGLSGQDIIKQIQKEIWNLSIENRKKMNLIEKCGEIEFRMTEGSDEFIQLEALLSQIALAGNN